MILFLRSCLSFKINKISNVFLTVLFILIRCFDPRQLCIIHYLFPTRFKSSAVVRYYQSINGIHPFERDFLWICDFNYFLAIIKNGTRESAKGYYIQQNAAVAFQATIRPVCLTNTENMFQSRTCTPALLLLLIRK